MFDKCLRWCRENFDKPAAGQSRLTKVSLLAFAADYAGIVVLGVGWSQFKARSGTRQAFTQVHPVTQASHTTLQYLKPASSLRGVHSGRAVFLVASKRLQTAD